MDTLQYYSAVLCYLLAGIKNEEYKRLNIWKLVITLSNFKFNFPAKYYIFDRIKNSQTRIRGTNLLNYSAI